MKITPETAAEFVSRYMLPDRFKIVLDLERSSGNVLVDARTDKQFIDCFGFVASNPLGHNHPKMRERSFEERLLRVARTKPSNSDFYTCEMAEFVQTFTRLAMPSDFDHLFFIEGGALGIENALKAAFDWKVRKNHSRGIKSELGTQILHFREAFHGRTGYTLSLTNTSDPRKYQHFPLFNWPRVTNPKIEFPLDDAQLAKVQRLEQQAVSEIEGAFAANKDDIAAIIIEPIQGEGGDNHFRPEFHRQLRQLADHHEALLIYDEVQSGLGITGKMWAYQHYGVVPDIVCFGKKSQVCGLMAGKRLDEVEKNVFAEASRLNSTWGGNLTDMVRAERYLQIMEEDGLLDNATSVGKILLRSLYDVQAEFPTLYTNARGLGLMCAIDAVSPEVRDSLTRRFYESGLLCPPCGTRSIRFRPSLTLQAAEVQQIITIIERASRDQLAQ